MNNESVVVCHLVAKCCHRRCSNWNGCQNSDGGRGILAHRINDDNEWQQMSPFTVFLHCCVRRPSSSLCSLSVSIVHGCCCHCCVVHMPWWCCLVVMWHHGDMASWCCVMVVVLCCDDVGVVMLVRLGGTTVG